MRFERPPGADRSDDADAVRDLTPPVTGAAEPVPVEVPLKRRLAAVLLADVVGYSRLMSLDEEGTHARITGFVQELFVPTIAEYGGRPARSMGDGMLVEFGSALDALRCGLDMQQRLAERQRDVRNDPIRLRIGINTGDVIVDDRDIYGHSVNVTARLESIANPGAVCVSQSIYDQTRSQPGLRFIDKGRHRVKNIDYPIHVFEVGYGEPVRSARRWLTRTTIAVAAACVVGLAALGAFVVRDRPAAAQENSIIVLPFRNLSGNTEDDYFADAITDDLTTDLSRLQRAFVIASATALTYKGRAVDARTIGREVGARYLLEGSVRRFDRRVQINAQLIDAQTGSDIWADRFTHESTTLQDLQESITGRIGASLNIQLVKARARHVAGSLVADRNSLDERLRGMALLIGTPTAEKYREAREHIEASLTQDPDSAESLALLARVLASEYLNGWNDIRLEHLDRAEFAYRRALELDPASSAAHYAGGFIRRVRGDHDGALYEFEQAIALNPNFAVAYAQKANELVFLGQGPAAVTAATRAISLSPLDPSIGVFYWVLGRAYFTEGDYEQTIIWLKKSITERPTLWFNRAWLISAYALTGRDKDAAAALTEFRQKFPTYTLSRITEIYTKENQYDNATIKAAIEHLFGGLQKAGLY